MIYIFAILALLVRVVAALFVACFVAIAGAVVVVGLSLLRSHSHYDGPF